MTHYWLDKQTLEIQEKARNGKLTGPEFIGQGCSEGVGSDCYGYYITWISEDRKTIGLVCADTSFEKDWTDGTQVCKMPERRLTDEWAVKYGKKWYHASFDTNIMRPVRMKGAKWRLRFNGAFSYRDPSF